ncbi:hypothetical protein ACSFEV_12155 [Pseudomonas fulva]|uniref:hypothetical protein n=1 Tax=Pseudomonas fulva TaxID=47880 RepID=UPI003EEC9758
MSETEPCSEYNKAEDRCNSGFPVLHSVCRGMPNGCHACGTPHTQPMCMREDLPAHLVREDGMPLGWPVK